MRQLHSDPLLPSWVQHGREQTVTGVRWQSRDWSRPPRPTPVPHWCGNSHELRWDTDLQPVHPFNSRVSEGRNFRGLQRPYALVRKFVILDAIKVEAMNIVGLVAAILSLDGVYWMVRDRDRKDEPHNPVQ
jgi:hypothetical protein